MHLKDGRNRRFVEYKPGLYYANIRESDTATMLVNTVKYIIKLNIQIVLISYLWTLGNYKTL